MSLKNEGQSLLDQPTSHEMHETSKLKISYTREFLLSLSDLDICKELPKGFDRSLLSEFEDASLDRQRSTGGLSAHNFRRNEYSSSPPTRGDTNSILRGTHGKWETRSSGRSDRDSDSQSEWESDSGKHFGNQSRRSCQGPEHDGLLGSGSFPRPSGYAPGFPAPKFRANGNYQLSRSNEPYQPPRPYKAPHSRRDAHDNYNDETFGSLECTSEDRAEEERKRRASFELMRKEQHKAFQEKQKLNPEKNKDNFDITSLRDDNEERLVNRSTESAEPPMTVSARSIDSEKSSLAHYPSAARPLVPPGFASTLSERSLGVKTSTDIDVTEVGQPDPGATRGNHILNTNSLSSEGKSSAKQVDDDQLHHRVTRVNVPIYNAKETVLNLSSAVDIPGINIGISDQLRKRSALSEAFDALENSEYSQLNASVEGTEVTEAFNTDDSHSTLNKHFVNALSLNTGNPTGVVQADHKAEEAWSPHAFQSSKFAHWFVEEEMSDDLTHRPNDLLSLIVGGEKGGFQVSDPVKTQHVAPASPFQDAEAADGHVTSNIAHTTTNNSEQPYKSNKPELVKAVLTCEDLEQSILSQVSENGSSLQQPIPDKDFYAKNEQSNSNIDNNASQHLLSLLQKRTCHEDMEQSSILAVDVTDNACNIQGATTGKEPDYPREANTDISKMKHLTLETLFGTAFMKELQSVGAPLSVQSEGSVGSTGANVLDSNLSLFPASDIDLGSAGEHALNRKGNSILPLEKTHQSQPNKFEKQWLDHGNPQGDVNSSQFQSELVKSSGFDGPNDIHLPEEDTLIAVSGPLQKILSASDSAKSDLFQDTPVDIAGKLAALSPEFRGKQPMMGNQEGLAYSCGPIDTREPGIPYQNLNIQQSSLHPPQLNHTEPMFSQVDSHPPHFSSYMKLMTPEGMAQHESPPNHQFPGMHLRPYHQPTSGLTGFDSPAHHSMLQQMRMQGNPRLPHLFGGFPRGVPLPAHPSNPMTGFMQEPNPMQGFPFNGLQQSTFGGTGMPIQASDVTGGRNHPEALQRLFEMELRSRARPGFWV